MSKTKTGKTPAPETPAPETPAPETPPVDPRSPAEILANPGRDLTYGEILDLEARIKAGEA